MPRLTCSVNNCVHNDNNSCKLGEIAVKGRIAHDASATCCSSFCDGTGSMSNASFGANTDAEVSIKCNARNCTYNQNTSCNALQIDVCGNGASSAEYTACSTFC